MKRFDFAHFRFIIVAILLFVTGCARSPEANTALLPREQPFVKTERPIPKILDINEQEREQIWSLAKLPKDEELGLSFIFHYLALYSICSENYRNKIDYLMSIIQDEETGKKVLGDPVFHSSKFGIAMVTGQTSRAQETHRDQGLAEFGLLGIPSTLEVKVGGRKRPLSEAIQECVANFYLQKENWRGRQRFSRCIFRRKEKTIETMSNKKLSKPEIVARLQEINAEQVRLSGEAEELLTHLQKTRRSAKPPIPLTFGNNVITWGGGQALAIKGKGYIFLALFHEVWVNL